jgi:tRNA(Ile)-lysidine synthase
MPVTERSPDGSRLLDAVRATVARHGLLVPGDRVLVAVSGGPDSVALLSALARLRAEQRLALHVCHVHHGLRPEADREAAAVRDLAARLDCPVTVERVRVVHRPDRSPEAAARTARYAALRRAAGAAGATRIALGHTADDQAETVLMRVLQGAGPRGLAGIPVRRGRLIRPLLSVDRAAVVAYLGAEGLPWVEDPSNRDPKMLRNRIRHELLPLLAAQGWPHIRTALRRTARAAREATEALDALLAPRRAGWLRPGPGGMALDVDRLAGLPPGAVKALLRSAVVEVAGGAGPRAAHLDRLAALVAARPGARVRLPEGVTVERARTALWLAPRRARLVEQPLAVPGETALPGWGLTLAVEIGGEAGPVPDRPDETWFDAAALPAALAVRPCRPGDRIVPFGADRPARVSQLLARTGAAVGARSGWPLLVGRTGGEETVLWVIGARRSGAAPVTRETRRCLRVRVAPGPGRHSREDST